MPGPSKVFQIFGDKARATEPAEHIMQFPGGSISVARVGEDQYWAHIEVNAGQHGPGRGNRASKPGVIIDSRVDYRDGAPIQPIPAAAAAQHIAVRIYTGGGLPPGPEEQEEPDGEQARRLA